MRVALVLTAVCAAMAWPLNKAGSRRGMAYDLAEYHLPRGMRREEVVELIGLPTRVRGAEWQYFMTDTDWLVVDFSVWGGVVRAAYMHVDYAR